MVELATQQILVLLFRVRFLAPQRRIYQCIALINALLLGCASQLRSAEPRFVARLCLATSQQFALLGCLVASWLFGRLGFVDA